MITFIDRPCGSGKTSAMIAGFKPTKNYFVVVPTLDEVERIKTQSIVPFTEPTEIWDSSRSSFNKMNHLLELVEDGENIVTTHKLFDLIDLRKVDLSMYEVLIDEVFDCVKHVQGPSNEEFMTTYVNDGYATVDKDGAVTATDKWKAAGDGVFRFNLLQDALKGRLYVADDGFYVSVVPTTMFTRTNSCIVHTFLAEGSLMAAYLRRFDISYTVDADSALDAAMRKKAKQCLDIRYLDLGSDKAFGYKRQGNLHPSVRKKIGTKLKNLKSRELKGVPTDKIMVTMRKSAWYDERTGKPSDIPREGRLGKAHWCHKSTKGTNQYRECVAAIHIYDLNLNPSIVKFLGMDKEQVDEWRTSELIQWAYRTSIRNEVTDPVTIYFASEAMKDLFEQWVDHMTEEFSLVEAA